MRRLFFLIIFVVLNLLTLTAVADIYTWKDAQGVIYFSDTPQPGATKVTTFSNQSVVKIVTPATQATPQTQAVVQDASTAITPADTITALQQLKGNLQNSATNAEGAVANQVTQPAAAMVKYTKLVINEPQPEATVINNPGNVPVNVTLEPALQTGHKIVALLDGKVVASSPPADDLTLPNVDRGTHTLKVQVKDNAGKVLISSSSVTFYMKRPQASANSTSP